ncbi:hypothetical protein KW785_01820 [Candidatus Parcubacteria bacterium]|nr:hypothetical protein [Candidatus Parcubacteria bacterium]
MHKCANFTEGESMPDRENRVYVEPIDEDAQKFVQEQRPGSDAQVEIERYVEGRLRTLILLDRELVDIMRAKNDMFRERIGKDVYILNAFEMDERGTFVPYGPICDLKVDMRRVC